MDIVLKLRELRRLRGLSQKDVGRLSGVGEKTVSSFETGDRIDSMKLSQLRKLLRVYTITEDEFFSRKLDDLFDPESLPQQTREDALLAGLEALSPPMRDALLERFELMLQAAQLAAASQQSRNTPVPPIARPIAASGSTQSREKAGRVQEELRGGYTPPLQSDPTPQKEIDTMHRIGRTFVRLSDHNRRQLDRLRRHHSLSRDHLVNTIVRDYFEALDTAAEPRLPRSRAA